MVIHDEKASTHVFLCSDRCGQFFAAVFITLATVPSLIVMVGCSGKHPETLYVSRTEVY